ncbi:hypothetical protein GGQ87_001465 [Brevundimonas alba]|uniref:Cell wall hydrolase n=1 Tax=Brevundimonas alba TaxID=74314 RepID=A0A7X5YKA3_9CAUL|nr:hypothetical protein [Brevundimonas alba]NJC41207.1 hypothetical protein [Brevundimonas alba]
MTRPLIALTLACAAFAASSVQAQTAPRYTAPGVDIHRYQADQHRYEMDRLRAQADQRAAFASQLQTETRLNRLEIEAARQPEPIQPQPYRALRSPEEERALRESATERRRTTASGVGQIDAWLDRPAR